MFQIFCFEHRLKFCFIDESSEPSTRGVLMGYTIICHTIGIFTTFFLNTLMPWRTVAMVCLGMPAITAIAICFVSVDLLIQDHFIIILNQLNFDYIRIKE